MVLQQPWDFPFEGVMNDRVSKPENKFILVNYIRRRPECDSCKLIENGWVNGLIIGCLNAGKVAKSLLTQNNRKELSVGYLLKFSSNQSPGKLGGLLFISFNWKYFSFAFSLDLS